MATKWACLGPGKISSDFFQAITEYLPPDDHQFIAVASKNLERAQQLADMFHFKRAYGSYEECAKDPEVDVVYIGTLITTHADLSIKMLEAGKHVICEKAMALSWAETKRVLDTAKKNNKFFMEAIWSRFFPVYHQIRAEKAAGTLGDIRLILVDFSVPIADVERLKKPELGGGGLPDIGIYPIQFACFVFDNEMPESITVVGNLMDTGVDECAVVVLKYKNGAIANLTYHTNAGTGKNVACIQGQKGRIDVGSPFWCPVQVTTPTGTYNHPLTGNYNFNNSGGLRYEAAAVRENVLKGELENQYVSHKDSEVIHKIMDEVRKQLGVKYE